MFILPQKPAFLQAFRAIQEHKLLFFRVLNRKSSISDIKNADIKEIAEIKIDKTQAGKTVEEIEETDFVSIYLIFRDDLSILPQKDTMLKLNDIIIIRDGN